MMDLDLRRRFFAEEIEAVCELRSLALVDAFATVARERVLRPGPWTVWRKRLRASATRGRNSG